MAKVQTVLGDKTTDDMGFTLVHEHLTVGFPGYEWDNWRFDRKKEVAGAVENSKKLNLWVSRLLLIRAQWNSAVTLNCRRMRG